MKKYALFNIICTSLFGVYLLTGLFYDYPKPIRIIILALYLILAIIRACVFVKFKK